MGSPGFTCIAAELKAAVGGNGSSIPRRRTHARSVEFLQWPAPSAWIWESESNRDSCGRDKVNSSAVASCGHHALPEPGPAMLQQRGRPDPSYRQDDALRRFEVNFRFAAKNIGDDILIKIGVGQETDSQPYLGASSRARFSFLYRLSGSGGCLVANSSDNRSCSERLASTPSLDSAVDLLQRSNQWKDRRMLSGDAPFLKGCTMLSNEIRVPAI